MIELTLTQAIILYLFFTLGVIFIIWGSFHLSRKRQKIDPTLQSTIVCSICHFPYLKEKGKQLSRCPQCQSLN